MNVHFKMKRRSSLWSWFRNLSPLFLGLLCGSVLSSLFQNLFQAQLCEPSCVEESTTAEIIDLDLDGHLGKFDNDESSASGDFRPTLATVNTNASFKSRPKFFATEMGIRQRLFIGFMVAVSDLQLLYDAMDNTLKEYANRVVFFVEKSSTNTSIFFGANVIELDTYVVKKLPSLAFDYINKRFNQFDWYFMVANRTIVNRFAIDRLMKQLSAGDSLFFGQLTFGNVCSLEAGILISRDLLDKLVDCNQEDTYNSIADYRCIFSHLQCTDTWKNVKFRSLKFRTDQWMKSNLVSENYEQILTVQGLESQSEVEMVQAELRRLESDHLQARLQSIRQEVLNLSNLLSENLTLPLGLAEPWRSADRYDLLKWDFFNATHMFPASSDEETAILLRGYDRLDVLAVSGFAIDWLKCKHGCCAGDGSSGGRLKSKCSDSAKLLSGYRRFDPNRGVDYVLDFLEINHHEQAQARMERVYLLRPVGNAELVPVPFVTESTSVTMLLRVRGFEIEQAVLFLDQFKRLCLDEDQRCNLILLMQRQANGTDDAMEHSLRKLRSVFGSWNAARGSRVQMVKLIGEACLVRMVDLVVSRLKTTRLLLLASPWMHLDREMLNRVRMQTVENFQAFFPVPFVHYHPTLTGLKQQWNANVGVRQHSQLGRNLGRFDRSNFEIASFYSTDYAYVRSLLHTENSFPNVAAQTTDSTITADGRYIFKLFCNTNQKNQDNGRKFHVMRAVDPAFQLIHPNTANCNLAADMTELEACLSIKKQNLGSRIQMASYLFNAKTAANLPTN